jgi:hypothetical protein
MRRFCFDGSAFIFGQEDGRKSSHSRSRLRVKHGRNAVVFQYDREFRSAWYQVKPGMHINADPKDQTNNFPQLIIVTRVVSRLGSMENKWCCQKARPS